eukprot:469403_1
MAFTTRHKKQTNNKSNEISTQLITDTSSQYDTFTDQYDPPTFNNQQPNKTRRSHSRSHSRSPASHLLSPSGATNSPSGDQIPRSSPVTPRKDNKLTPKSKTQKKRSKGPAIFGFRTSSTDGSVPKMQYTSMSAQTSRLKALSSRPQTAHIRAISQEKTEKGLIKHKNIVPQLWDNEFEWVTSESDTYDPPLDPPPTKPPRLSKLPSGSVGFDTFKRKMKKIFPMTPQITSSRTKRAQSNVVRRKGSNYTQFPDTEVRHETSRQNNKQFILDRLQTKNTTASLFRRRSVVMTKTPRREYRPPSDENHTMGSRLSFSIHEEPPTYEMLKQDTLDYNQFPLKKASYASNRSNKLSFTSETTGASNRKQLVFIGGIKDMNRLDVRARLFDLFEMWGDRPDLNISETDDESYAWKHRDCIYVRFPSIAQAVAGIKVFDGLQPNGYALTAKLVLEGSQMVYIDGLDADWNEEIFGAYLDANTDYKVLIKRHEGDKAYAFVQFASLEAVQSAIDKFDGETEIAGKLVRWEQMVKAYIGCIGEETTVKDIQKELSEFDPSFRYLPIKIHKSREPIYYPQVEHKITAQSSNTRDTRKSSFKQSSDDTTHNDGDDDIHTDTPIVGGGKNVAFNAPMIKLPDDLSPSMPTIKSREASMDDSNSIPSFNVPYDGENMKLRDQISEDEAKSSTPLMMINTNATPIKMYDDLHETDNEEDELTSTITDLTSEKFEYEWHYYAYVWFWNKYDALRAQSRFDERICFGSGALPVRFLLMNDMTQKVYVSGLMAKCASKESIEWDIHQLFVSDTALWRKKCIITYRENGRRPFAYLRFPSIEASKEAIKLFDNEICFGNQEWPIKKERARIHLEVVREAGDLLSNNLVRKWHPKRYWWLSAAVLVLPLTLSYEWAVIGYQKCRWCRKKHHTRTGAVYDDNEGGGINMKNLKEQQKNSNHRSHTQSAKELAFCDLLQAMFCFNEWWREVIAHNRYNMRCILVLASYALYFVFYMLIMSIMNVSVYDLIFSALLPIIMYIVIGQLFSCWCAMQFEVALPQLHVLEHVSMYFENYILYSMDHVMASEFVICKEWDHITYPWQYPIECNKKKKLILLSLIYAIMYRLPWLVTYDEKMDVRTAHYLALEAFAAILMFCFCFVLFCCFETIVTRTLSYWRQVHGITELITYRGAHNNSNFLSLNNEQNLFAWLTLRAFIHRKGDTVFCGLEMNALFLVICVFLNLATIVIVMFGIIEKNADNLNSWTILFGSGRSGFILSQIWFLAICLYYIGHTLLIGYWFGKENQSQLNRLEKQKLYLYTERMKQLLNHEKYKRCDMTKINDLKILLNSMDALIQHVETNQITPQLWGIKMNDFKWKIVMTVIAAVIPSFLVRWMLNS